MKNIIGTVLLCATIALASSLGHAQTLPELVDIVLYNHPSVRAQQSLGEAARQAVEGAKWQFYPTPSISFEQIAPGQADPSYPDYGDKNVTTLRLQQPLWTGGRLTAGLNKAQAGAVVAQASLDLVRQDLAIRVVQIYADWAGALFKRQAFEKSLTIHQTLQAQILRRISGGVSPRSDLTLLQGRAQQTRADLSAANAQEQTALARLSQLLGKTLQTRDLTASMSTALPLEHSALELMQLAQTKSPSVQKLLAQSRIAEEDINELRAVLMPEVYLRLESQYGSFTLPGSPNVNRLFVGVTSRFGAGLSSFSQLSGAKARLDAALADVDGARISLGEQILADYAQADAGSARLASLIASLESSDGIALAWGRQFIAGRKTWLDVMNAARELAQLEAQIADARSSQLLLTWRLSITGRGLNKTLALGDERQATAALSTPKPEEAQRPRFGEDPAGAPLLYDGSELDRLDLRPLAEIDPANLVGMTPSATRQ